MTDHFQPPPHRTGLHPGWLLLAGWLAFFVLWTLFILGWGQGEVTLSGASISGLITTITAAVLAVGVWKLTERLPWPEALRLAFLLFHLLTALLFSLLWTLTVPIISILMEGGSVASMDWSIQTYSWRLFMGVWLYFIVAGVSYATRVGRHLQQQREVASRAEALAAKASLDAMRSQLRPHFLFNALHSVSSLIESDPARAADAMEMLGDLLRYTIREREGDRVRMEEEWQFAMDFVDLQRLRFGDRLVVSHSIDPECAHMEVPPFVLQPLVENAFRHGAGEAAEGGSIHIEARCANGWLRLEVTDSGNGSMARASQEADSEAGLPDESIRGNGSGLANLRARLTSTFGPTASVNLATDEKGWTRATVTLPIEEP